MADRTQSNDGGRGGLAWLAALTTLTGLLAAFVITILRLGRPHDGLDGTEPSDANGVPAPVHTAPARPLPPAPIVQARSVVPARVTTPAGTGLPAVNNQAAAAVTQPASATRWNLATKYAVGIGIFLSLVLLVYISRNTLSLIIFAVLIAFIVRPAIGFLNQRFKVKRGMATILIYLLVLVLLITLPLLLVPPIVNSINFVLGLDFQAAVQSLTVWLQTSSDQVKNIPILGQVFGPLLDSFYTALVNFSTAGMPGPVAQVTVNGLADQLARTLGLLVGVLGPLISGVLAFVLMILISLHLSLSAETIQASYPQLIPEAYRSEISDLVERIVNVWSAFLRGQLSLMLMMGVLVFLLNLLLGTPYPLFLGFLAGVLEIIPSLGPLLATIPAVLLALISGSTHFAIAPLPFTVMVIAGYLLLSVLENQLIVPKILGEAVSLPPLAVILGCVIGGALFGILGVFLSTPVISTGKEIYGYLYGKILEPVPVEKPPEEKSGLMDSFRKFTGRLRLPGRRPAQPSEEGPDGQAVQEIEEEAPLPETLIPN